MKKDISEYQQRLNLHDATFMRIEHDDAMVADVYKITQPNGSTYILKICAKERHYLWEVFFLRYFADTLPVPQIIAVVEPTDVINGALLMECLPGQVIKVKDLTDSLAFQMGVLLARIHQNKTAGYGDIIFPESLTGDPRGDFTHKFNESLAECKNHIPDALLKKCRMYLESHINLLKDVDGPCLTHRDFRPGNIMVKDGIISGIIDWSGARAGYAQEDFCIMEHGDWEVDPTHKKSFLDGYATIRPVPEYAKIMPLLRLRQAVATVGFCYQHRLKALCDTYWFNYNRQFIDTFLDEYKALS